MRASGRLFAAGMLATLLGCATTSHDQRADPAPWRPAEAKGEQGLDRSAPASKGEVRDVYVAAFGLRREVAERWPRLLDAQVGLGLGNRVAEAVYGTGAFRLLEEKAELARRLAGDLGGPAGRDAPLPEAPWLLYGEVTGVRVRRQERVAGLKAESTARTTVSVELRLVERASRKAWVAAGRGEAEGPAPREAAELDPSAVADATGAAVEEAVEALLLGLPR